MKNLSYLTIPKKIVSSFLFLAIFFIHAQNLFPAPEFHATVESFLVGSEEAKNLLAPNVRLSDSLIQQVFSRKKEENTKSVSQPIFRGKGKRFSIAIERSLVNYLFDQARFNGQKFRDLSTLRNNKLSVETAGLTGGTVTRSGLFRQKKRFSLSRKKDGLEILHHQEAQTETSVLSSINVKQLQEMDTIHWHSHLGSTLADIVFPFQPSPEDVQMIKKFKSKVGLIVIAHDEITMIIAYRATWHGGLLGNAWEFVPIDITEDGRVLPDNVIEQRWGKTMLLGLNPTIDTLPNPRTISVEAAKTYLRSIRELSYPQKISLVKLLASELGDSRSLEALAFHKKSIDAQPFGFAKDLTLTEARKLLADVVKFDIVNTLQEEHTQEVTNINEDNIQIGDIIVATDSLSRPAKVFVALTSKREGNLRIATFARIDLFSLSNEAALDRSTVYFNDIVRELESLPNGFILRESSTLRLYTRTIDHSDTEENFRPFRTDHSPSNLLEQAI